MSESNTQGKLILLNGSPGSPTLTFNGSTGENDGFFYKSAGVIGVSIAGVEIGNFNASGFSGGSSTLFSAENGTAAAPAFTFTSDTTTGIYKAGTLQLGFSTNGVSAGNIDSTQNWTFAAKATMTGVIQTNAASNQLVINPGAHKFTITAAAPAADRTLTIPDPGGAASFVLTAGTTQSIAGTVTFSGQLIGKGTATNDSAAAGNIGEILTQSRLQSAGTAATSATPLNVTTAALALTAGDWDVIGVVGYTPAATTSVTRLEAAISTTTASMPSADTIGVPDANGQVRAIYSTAANVNGGADFTVQTITSRVSLTGTTNYFLVANTTFSVSTLSVYGSIRARRVR